MAIQPHDALELIAKACGAILGLCAVVVSFVKSVRWVGRTVSDFVDEKVMPPIERLASSVNDLASSTHENGAMLTEFMAQQRATNLQTVTAIAHIEGHLRIEKVG